MASACALIPTLEAESLVALRRRLQATAARLRAAEAVLSARSHSASTPAPEAAAAAAAAIKEGLIEVGSLAELRAEVAILRVEQQQLVLAAAASGAEQAVRSCLYVVTALSNVELSSVLRPIRSMCLQCWLPCMHARRPIVWSAVYCEQVWRQHCTGTWRIGIRRCCSGSVSVWAC
jgi:hypothetical protein